MRYFIEVSYKGTQYAGFQIQSNAQTIQSEVERAFSIVFRSEISLTGSSRTDAGVHAMQNFFHFDTETPFDNTILYNLNSLLPPDIVVRSVIPVDAGLHCRFLAISRQYAYYITTQKDPFTTQTAWFYPYKLDYELLNEAAAMLYNHTNFTAFSKRNTQVTTKTCTITTSQWSFNQSKITYSVTANRFLRGMVRGLVGTMLLVGRKKITINRFEEIILAQDSTKANFATPPHGLFLIKVNFPFSLDTVDQALC